MYKLTVDCGTANDTFLIDNVEDYREYMEGFEQHYLGSAEDLLEKGIICCGIDTLTLEEVFNKYEISVDTLLHRKDENNRKYYSHVKSLHITSVGEVEINIQNFWFYGGQVYYDDESYSGCSTGSIYKYWGSPVEGGRLFNS